MLSRSFFGRIFAWSCFAICIAAFSGCGTTLPVSPFPNALTNLTLEELQAIQDDETLDAAAKAQAIRDRTGIPADVAGDRLIDFLLALPLP